MKLHTKMLWNNIEDLEGDYKYLKMNIVGPEDLDDHETERLVGV